MEERAATIDLCTGAHAEPHAGEVARRHNDRKRARGRRRRHGARGLDLLGIDGLRGPRRLNIDLVNLRLRRLDHLSLNRPGLPRERHHETRTRVYSCWHHYSQRLARRRSTNVELRARQCPGRYGHRKVAFHPRGSVRLLYGRSVCAAIYLRGSAAAAIYGAVRGYYTGPCSVRGYTGPFSVASRRDSRRAAIIQLFELLCQSCNFRSSLCFAARVHVQPQGVLANHKTGI